MVNTTDQLLTERKGVFIIYIPKYGNAKYSNVKFLKHHRFRITHGETALKKMDTLCKVSDTYFVVQNTNDMLFLRIF